MSKQESVSSIQMSVLFLILMSSSSIYLIPAPLTDAAKNGAWLSLLLALAMGMLFLACILYLHRKYPGMTFIEYSRHTIGKWMTILVAVPYVCILFWHIATIVLYIAAFIKTAMLKETPDYVICSLFFVMIALTVRAGIEVIARMSGVLLFMMFGFIIAIWAMVAPLYHPEYLLPVMPDGFKPILHGAYIAYGLPYAELPPFAMILPFVRKKDEGTLGKYLFFALVVNGLFMLTSIISTIMVLGPLAGDLKYSLYVLARMIFVQEIIERIESVIGFSLVAGTYMKAVIYLFILNKALSQLLKLQDNRTLIFPIAFICLLLSITMYPNEIEAIEAVYVIWPVVNTTFYVLPLLLIIIVTLFKKRQKTSEKLI
ncbi:endospore germination permease [Paenibacillus kribbensis]|uniref:GerAB/ArcD/ProY family transporter n=1 Tax=Paenibacillus TaxID=44249 RepID=UPI00024F0154|nr:MULTISPECIES: endospore germination permease [Paenibacillus]EHS57493.1 spore germination protein [Paenibacillus sp. Aloe-11]MEC0236351.1 endospore germination permease [Paenibacillus kribbensis]